MATSEHTRFAYKSLDDIRADLRRMGLRLPICEDLSPLTAPLEQTGMRLPNRLCILPMEGCDATDKGAPTNLTVRRYRRFAGGGAGLVWAEANAVVQEGRANPRQLYLNSRTLDAFAAMTAEMDEAARSAYPDHPQHHPYKVLQLTHSGRYAKPDYDNGEAVCAQENPYLDPYLPPNHRVITDDELDQLIPAYVNAAVLAARAGFDAVDVKACHLYLLSELLGSRGRPGKYGGAYENRTRLLFEILDRIQEKTGGLGVAARINGYDALPYPYGFGVSRDETAVPDLEESVRLVQELAAHGVRLLAVSVGNPYYNPHIGRPYDVGPYTPFSHQLADTVRILEITRTLQQAAPQVAVVSTGMSWLRQFAAPIAAGCIRDGWFTVAGFGRQAFAYPDFARDIVQDGGMRPDKCCVCCSSCTTIMRCRGTTGCPVRDKEVYGPILRACTEGKPKTDGRRLRDHI